MRSRLIINADDFGLTEAINRSVMQLHTAGVLRSATLMATGGAFGDAVERAHQSPTLGVGCHLVFVDGVPVSHPESIPTLLGADGKTFRPSLADFAQAVLRGTVRPAEIAREAQAQIQKLQRAGIDVTHVDTHKHTHVFPAVLDPVLHAAERSGVSAIRCPFEPVGGSGRDGTSLLRRVQMAWLSRYRGAFVAKTTGLAAHGGVPAATYGIAATGRLDATVLRALLVQVEAGGQEVVELCCHPGIAPDVDLDAVPTRLRGSRQVEHDALLAVVPHLLAQPNAPELIHYGCLGVAGLQRASGQFVPYDGFEKAI